METLVVSPASEHRLCKKHPHGFCWPLASRINSLYLTRPGYGVDVYMKRPLKSEWMENKKFRRMKNRRGKTELAWNIMSRRSEHFLLIVGHTSVFPASALSSTRPIYPLHWYGTWFLLKGSGETWPEASSETRFQCTKTCLAKRPLTISRRPPCAKKRCHPPPVQDIRQRLAKICEFLVGNGNSLVSGCVCTFVHWGSVDDRIMMIGTTPY